MVIASLTNAGETGCASLEGVPLRLPFSTRAMMEKSMCEHEKAVNYGRCAGLTEDALTERGWRRGGWGWGGEALLFYYIVV